MQKKTEEIVSARQKLKPRTQSETKLTAAVLVGKRVMFSQKVSPNEIFRLWKQLGLIKSTCHVLTLPYGTKSPNCAHLCQVVLQ